MPCRCSWQLHSATYLLLLALALSTIFFPFSMLGRERGSGIGVKGVASWEGGVWPAGRGVCGKRP